MIKFKDLAIKPNVNVFTGEKIKIERILNKEIIVSAFEVSPSKYDGDYLSMQIEVGSEKRVVFTGSKILIDLIKRVPKDSFPFSATIVKENEYYEFT